MAAAGTIPAGSVALVVTVEIQPDRVDVRRPHLVPALLRIVCHLDRY